MTASTPSREQPTHIVEPGARKTRCGISTQSRNANPCPYVGAQHVQMHIDGYGMVVCEACRG